MMLLMVMIMVMRRVFDLKRNSVELCQREIIVA